MATTIDQFATPFMKGFDPDSKQQRQVSFGVAVLQCVLQCVLQFVLQCVTWLEDMRE